MPRITLNSGVVRVDEVLATVVTLMTDNRALFPSGTSHRQFRGPEIPTYLHEATLLHALRVVREWIMDTHQVQDHIHHIHIRAGSALVHYQVSKWLRGEGCTLASPAASGIIQEISNLAQWLTVDMTYQPFNSLDEIDPTSMPLQLRYHLGHSENLRATILPQQTLEWRANLPQVPWTAEEVRVLLRQRFEADEQGVLQALAELGSISASILVYLNLSKGVVAEAFRRLREERAAQTNLAEILGATRYRVCLGGKLHHTVCPKRYCYQKDSFLHMLDCYHLTEQVQRGPDAVPFLLRLAKSTTKRRGHVTIPYTEAFTAQTR